MKDRKECKADLLQLIEKYIPEYYNRSEVIIQLNLFERLIEIEKDYEHNMKSLNK